MQPSQLLVFALTLCLFAACAHAPQFIQNVHEVVPDKVYRSAQLSPGQLDALIDRHGIKSVLNLRGAAPGEDWYDGERATAQKRNVDHYDFALSSRVEVPKDQAEALIRIMRDAPKPMLIHCWAGADRTGLATALYLYALENHPPERAARALSWKFHHFSFTSAGAMDRSFAAFTNPVSEATATVTAEP